MIRLDPVGVVHNAFEEPTDPETMLSSESTLEIKSPYEDGLEGIEQLEHLIVVFFLHRAGEVQLVGPRRVGEPRGVFASRSPHRPNPIGMTTVRLLERRGRLLSVRGLDAVDGTPLLDIKPYAALYDEPRD